METTHTPEPWETFNVYGSLAPGINSKNGDSVLLWKHKDDASDTGLYGDVEQTQANAERIVACVNACAGLKNEELAELPSIIDEGTIAIEENKKLKAEREELINLLKQSHEILTRKSFNNSQLVEAMLSKYLQSLKETKGGSNA